MRTSARLALAVAAPALAACGLSATGTATPHDPDASVIADARPPVDAPDAYSNADGPPPPPADSGPGDALEDADVVDAPLESGTCAPDAGPSCVVVPTGWSLSAVDFGAASPCPVAFGPAKAVVADPNVPPAACTCPGCTVTQPPSCTAGPVTVNYSIGAGGCGAAGTPPQNMNNPAGTCATDLYPGPYDDHWEQYIPSPPVGGACSMPPATKQPQSVLYATQATACPLQDPATAGCQGPACTLNLPSAFDACVVTTPSGVACPPGFPAGHAMMDSADFDCGACGCSVSASCTGTMALYASGDCSGSASPIAADGLCHNPNLTGDFRSYRFTGTVAPGASCMATPPLPSNIRPVSPQTICCTH